MVTYRKVTEDGFRYFGVTKGLLGPEAVRTVEKCMYVFRVTRSGRVTGEVTAECVELDEDRTALHVFVPES